MDSSLRNRPRAGNYSPYKDMLGNKAGAEAFEAPLAEEDAPEAQTPAQGVQEGIRMVDAYAPSPDDYTFEDLQKSYNYTIRPDGDIYFHNKAKNRKGVIPAGDTSARAVKARAAILAMKEKAPRATPAEPPNMSLRGPAPGTTADMSMADFDKSKGAR
jgi:hypothetical protein